MRIEKPLNQKDLAAGDLIPKGIYDFQVIEAEDQISKSGNEMVALKLKVWMADGRERIVFDYLLEQLAYKLGHFCESTGLIHKYQEGAFSAHDCIGKSGQLKLGIQQDKTGQYGDKNSVLDYIPSDEILAAKAEAKVATAKAAEPDPDFDDKIPF